MGRRTMLCAALITLVATAPACTQILGFDEDYQVGADAGPSPIPCSVPTDCPGQEDECNTRTCVDSACGKDYAPAGTTLLSQTPGDCRLNVCDGEGRVVQQPDDKDVPADANDCTEDACTMGAESHDPVPAGTPCGQGDMTQCDGNGNCAGCTMDSDCGVPTACVSWSCSTGICISALAVPGTPCGDAESCVDATHTIADLCNDAGLCVDGGTQTCAPYACGGTTCATSCTGESDCAPGHACNASECIDCTTCAEWLATPTPFTTTTFCQDSNTHMQLLALCACTSCASDCVATYMCNEGDNMLMSCLSCTQSTCAGAYNDCANDL